MKKERTKEEKKKKARIVGGAGGEGEIGRAKTNAVSIGYFECLMFQSIVLNNKLLVK
jgi:hypothetical protein